MRAKAAVNSSKRGAKNYKREPLNRYYRSSGEQGSQSPFKPRLPKRNGRKLLFGIADLLLAAILLIALVYSLLLSGKPQIKSNDYTFHDHAYYQSQIAGMFGGIDNSNKLTFSEKQVVNQIEKKFPEVRSASVELPFFSEQPTVWLNISPPTLNLTNATGSYVVDGQGVLVAKVSQLPHLTKLIQVNDQTGFTATVGQPVLSSQSVNFIAQLSQQLKQSKITISSLNLPPLAQELDLKAIDQAYYVKFYMGGDVKLQAGQYIAAVHQFATKGQPPAEYLDVRVPGKIFYK